MTITSETIALLIVIVLPGFAAFYVNSYFSTAEKETESNLKLVLLSLFGSTILFAIEVLIVDGYLTLFPGSGYFKLQFMTLAEQTPTAYFTQHPIGFSALLAGLLLFNLVIMVAFGWQNPISKLFRRLLGHRELSNASAWHTVLLEEQLSKGRGTTIVRVRMKNGDIYTGQLGFFSLREKRDGSRDFSLTRVEYFSRGDPGLPEIVGNDQENNALLLNSANVDAIEIVYAGDR